MAKKENKPQPLNDDGTMTYEEWEAAQAAMNKDKKKGQDDPDAGPVAPPAPIPENPSQPPTAPPVEENNETLILTGDAENPILIVIVDGVEVYHGPPDDRPKHSNNGNEDNNGNDNPGPPENPGNGNNAQDSPGNSPEKDAKDKTNKEGTS